MRTPAKEATKGTEDSFSSAHERVRSGGVTGTVELIDAGDAGAVFLDGVAVYARYADEYGVEALSSLSSVHDSEARVVGSSTDAVRMFETYLRYLGDDALIRAEPLDGATLEIQRVEGVLVDGVRNLAAASWRGESDTSDRTFFPDGERTALVPTLVSLKRHVAANDMTGYAAGDGRVVTFLDGELVDGASVNLNDPVRSEVEAGGGWVVVDSEVSTEEDEDDPEGLLSRLL